jgi:hypothetical protein
MMKSDSRIATNAGSYRFVALLDVLGFTRLVESAPLADVARQLEDAFHMVSAMTDESNRLRRRFTAAPDARVDALTFSDLILLYSTSDSHRDFIDIIRVCSRVVHRAFHSGLLLRGGVSWGRCIIEPPVVVGQPITEAAALEKQQDWAGVCLGKSIEEWATAQPFAAERTVVIEGMIGARWLTQWRVPFKTPDSSPVRRAVNWVVDAITPEKHGVCDLQAPLEADVVIKCSNTQKFLRHVLPIQG